ncbi:MAG: response regulator transcription factor [Solirubrobacteraceae bacterium]
MIDPPPANEPLALARPSEASGALTFRSGSEVAGIAEALYLRLFVGALGCLPFICGLTIVVALARTNHANFVRTTALALGLALLASLALRAPARCYRIMRRWPVLSLTPPLLALGALAADHVLYSPLSYPATVCIAFPALVCGRRWALAAATLISVGAITTATILTGPSAINSVGQGAAGYFVWALVLAGLTERFARLAMQMPPTTPAPVPPAAPIAPATDVNDPPRIAPPATPSPPPAPAPDPPPDGGLTARQIQVVALLADGLRADDIAARLGISTSTVYRHIDRAKTRMGVASRSELVAVAMRDGLLSLSTP